MLTSICTYVRAQLHREYQGLHVYNIYTDKYLLIMNKILWWHISDNYVDLSDLYVVLSDLYIDLCVDLSLTHFW